MSLYVEHIFLKLYLGVFIHFNQLRIHLRDLKRVKLKEGGQKRMP